MSNVGEVEARQESPANVKDFYEAALHVVIKAGALSKVESALEEWHLDASSPGPTQKDIDYLVARAAEKDGKPAILQYLLSQGGTINNRTTHIATPPEIFQVFMEHGWKADNKTLGSHLTDPDLVSFFISHGAPVGPGSHAVNAAAQGDAPDHIPVMDRFLDHIADANALALDFMGPSEAGGMTREGRKGTPLHSAAKWGNDEARVWLLNHVADPEARNELRETPAEWAKRYEVDGPQRTVRVQRALMEKSAALKRKNIKEAEEWKEKMQESDRAGAA